MKEYGFTPVKTVAFDFDNTLSTIPKFVGIGALGPPIEGAREFIETLKTHGWKIIIFSTRSAEEIKPWLRKHRIPYHEINKNSNLHGTNPGKPVYDVLIDDRCIPFQGKYDHNLLRQILDFKPYYEQDKRP